VFAVAEPGSVPAARRVAGLEQRFARIRAGTFGLFRNDNPNPSCHFAHRAGIVHPESFTVPGKDITRGVTDETVVEVLARDHREVAVGPAMERTGPAPVAAAPLESDRLLNYLEQVGGVAHL